MGNLKLNIFVFCGKMQFDSFTHYIHFLVILTQKNFRGLVFLGIIFCKLGAHVEKNLKRNKIGHKNFGTML